MTYTPGTHIIASLESASAALLSKHAALKVCINELISRFNLQKLGEVYYDFPTGGYTAVICLSESHISIHTWPEYNLANLDIYLSNYQRNNDGTVENIYKTFIEFFEATARQKQTIIR